MRHIQTKYDWFYEFRPYLIVFFGFLGVLTQSQDSSALLHVGQACGVLLLILAYKIMSWRREYRKARRH